MSDVSLEQITHLLSSISKSGVDGEHFQKLFTSGYLHDLLIGNINAVNRDEFRKLLDLPKLGEQRFLAHVIVTSEGVPIHVDRSVQPDRSVYSGIEVGRIIYLGIESFGPADYNLTDVDLWQHGDQLNNGETDGYSISKYLEKHQMIASCLSLRDGEEIQKKGVSIFRKFFGNNRVFLWKSLVQCKNAELRVPFLAATNSSGVILRSTPLNYSYGSNDVVARFR